MMPSMDQVCMLMRWPTIGSLAGIGIETSCKPTIEMINNAMFSQKRIVVQR